MSLSPYRDTREVRARGASLAKQYYSTIVFATQPEVVSPRGTQPGMRSNREETCHLLAADFPRHSRYTERCWMRSRRVHAAWGCLRNGQVEARRAGSH